MNEEINNLDWLSGGGEMGKLIRSIDWSKNSLGPVETWPQSLKTAVSLCLSSTFPINIVWGPDHIQIYNDAYRPICGALHPGSMGSMFKVLWASALSVVGEAFDRGLKGEGTYIPNQRMFLERFGYLEETFMTFSFSPIRDESGNVGGIFHPISESTEKMLSSRRTQVIRDLAIQLARAKSLRDVYDLTAAIYQGFELDLPFVMFYEMDPNSGMLELKEKIGLQSIEKSDWNFNDVIKNKMSLRVDGISNNLGAFKSGPYEENPKDAVMLPIHTAGSEKPVMIIVAGMSSRRAPDDEYLAFYDTLKSTVSAAVGNILAYEEEQKRAEALAQIDKAKTAFFSNVSHEFRTPLTLILGPLEDFLKDQDHPLTFHQRQKLEVVHRNSLRLLKLVNSLLDFSRIEAGRVQAFYVPVDLSKFTAELASLFRSSIEKAGLKLNIDTISLPQPIYVDRDMWEKIILNLLSNAFKFTFSGGIEVKVGWVGNGAQIQVKDTGIGVSKEELPRLFERFHRVHGAKGRTYEGTGIGLALVQELINMHGGEISASSEIGFGTTFTIFIPAGIEHLPKDKIGPASDLESTSTSFQAYLQEAEMWTEEDAVHQTPVQGDEKPLILLVDDNSDMRAYLERILKSKWSVLTAKDGAEGFEKAKLNNPALILTDVMMPVLDGFGLLSKIRGDDQIKATPVILLSARAGEEAKVEGLTAGADDYLVKPFSAKELLLRVEALLKMNEFRYETSAELKANAEKFRSMFFHSPVSIAMFDLAGNIMQINDSFLKMTGYVPEEVVGKHFSAITHNDDMVLNSQTFEKLTSGKILSAILETRYLKKNGEPLWVKTSVSTYLGNDQKPLYMIAISQDFESIKAAELKYQRIVVTLEEERFLREKFVATLSHDLRSPLTAAKMSAQLMQKKPDNQEFIQNQAARIVQNINRIDQMILDMLDANRIKAGKKLPLQFKKCDMNQLIKDVLSGLTTIHGERFVFNTEEESILGEWDCRAIERVIENLINNAVKYGLKYRPITILTALNDAHVFVSVHNHGNPISQEDQDDIFDPYKRTRSAENEQRGWGLGLTFIKEVIEAHGGVVILESLPKLGTTFSFSIPLDAKAFYENS